MLYDKIFKSYDIRGTYPDQLNEESYYQIGRAIVSEFKPKSVAIGRDVRPSSPSLYEALTRGITDSGANVVNLGITSTPMVYFAASRVAADMFVSLTASHNPPVYNGLKLCHAGGLPVGEKTGLTAMKQRILSGDLLPMADVKGTVTEHDLYTAYHDFFASYATFGDTPFKLVIDCANAMGVLELPIYERFPNLEVTYLYRDLNNAFGAHEANPLNLETLDELRAKVVEVGADLGIAYDGDADRVGFVDERGEIVPMDLMTGLLATEVLKAKPGSTILYDLRSSRAVKEAIEEAGGTAVECMVGHANIKRQMREVSSPFAGELSGHYYFAENSGCEAGTLPALMLLNQMAKTGAKISALVQKLRRYAHSGEINSTVADKDAVLGALEEKYADGTITHLDGIKVDYSDWWFNVRASNTEPLLRLNLECRTVEETEAKKNELLAIIRG